MGSGYGGSNSSIIFSGLTSATAPTTRCSSPVLADDDERLSDCSEYPSNQPLFLNFTSDLAPFNAAKKQKSRKSNVYKVSGVNILNRNSVESRTVMERIQRRRENHNFVERRRRDNINYTITELAGVIPAAHQDGAKLNKGSVLRMAVDYI
ncbi:helix-loop-helix DNA-binding domain-containing protein, partial [Dimargaris cristalligena]